MWKKLLLRSDPVIQYLMRLLLARFRSTHDAAGLQQHPHSGPTAPAETAHGLDLHHAAVRTLSLAQDLSDAIALEQLELYYQPLIAFDHFTMVGYEALIRWNHPTLGLVSPAEFIPLAEKTGLIHRIGKWVLHQAVADWAALRPLCADTAQHRKRVAKSSCWPA